MDYDAVLQHLGESGAYQRRLAILLSLIGIPAGLHVGAMTFIAAIPDHHCRMPQTTPAGFNLTLPAALNMSIPLEEVEGAQRLSRCRRYDVTDQFGWLNSTTTTSTCTDGWEYDQSQYHSSIVSQYDLVCDRAWLREMAQSIFMAGVGLGGIVFGFMSDRFGRHVTLMTCLLLQLTFGVSAAFTSNLVTFAILRFLVGAVSNGAYYAGFVIGTVQENNRREIYLHNQNISWRYEVPEHLFSLFPYARFLSESPRWLIFAKKTDEARKVIERIAKENGVSLSQETFEKLNGCAKVQQEQTTPSNRSRKYSVIDLVRTPQMRKITLAMNVAWLISVCVYYSLMLGTSQLVGDHYVNFVLGACVEIVAMFVAWVTMDRWGRKRPFIIFIFVAGVSCLAAAGVPHDLGVITTTFAMAGRFGISIGFCTLTVYSAEVFPTVIRNMGVGQASMVSRLGGVMAPFIGLLGNVWRPLPLLMYGVLSCVAGAAVTVLPETHGISLPNTPEDLECLARRLSIPSAAKCPDETESATKSSDETAVYEMVSSL
ncbi:organic cation transporter protein-like [Branchiostoma floridae]|uniref:Organic cation transporter protein-like n=1 Tax=Branchiostoma floridae TaxID=7739 RepID=A0A9J7LLL3_BRAFL|nr:organic cation transporter protein-like [Branchiostoma floridae]